MPRPIETQHLFSRRHGRRHGALVLLALFPFVVGSAGCRRGSGSGGGAAEDEAPPRRVLRLATTTSTRDSGLLDVILPPFEKQNDCDVRVVAVGTGAALELGEAGDVDALIVHSREAELAFVEAGHGTVHEEFMVNAFVLLGPADDPVDIASAETASTALQRIASAQHKFISRGDDSGTHQRERQLWKEASAEPDWPTYLECGQGMGATLTMADEQNAYVLSDYGTYLKHRGRLQQLKALFPKEPQNVSDMPPLLRNPYSAIAVNSMKNEKINSALAKQFIQYLLLPNVQRQIQDYQVEGQSAFQPTRLAD